MAENRQLLQRVVWAAHSVAVGCLRGPEACLGLVITAAAARQATAIAATITHRGTAGLDWLLWTCIHGTCSYTYCIV